jgi:hypothetical protein
MNGLMESLALRENSAVDVQVADAVFVGLVFAIADGLTTILMDGQVRVGTVISLTQGDVCEKGRVQRCHPLPDGCGFELTIAPLASQNVCSNGFEWPAHLLSHLAMKS